MFGWFRNRKRQRASDAVGRKQAALYEGYANTRSQYGETTPTGDPVADAVLFAAMQQGVDSASWNDTAPDTVRVDYAGGDGDYGGGGASGDYGSCSSDSSSSDSPSSCDSGGGGGGD